MTVKAGNSERPLRIEVRGDLVRAICPHCPRRGTWHGDFTGTYYPSKVARARHAFGLAHVTRHSRDRS